MSALKARVYQGRIVINQKTDLPEGTELELVRVDQLDSEEREEFIRDVRAGLDDVSSGRVVNDSQARGRLEARFGRLDS